MFILLLSFSSVTAFAPVHRETNPRQSTITLQLSPSEEDYFSLDMKELRQRIDQEYGSYIPIEGPSNRLQLGKRPNQNPDKVHVVIFQPETINQGAHTIEYPKGSGNNVVLAFESIDACRNFAASLAQQNFVDPTVRPRNRCSHWPTCSWDENC